jgi:hypothetical protein
VCLCPLEYVLTVLLVQKSALTGRLALILASRKRFLTVWSEILLTPGIVNAVGIAVVNLSRTCKGRYRIQLSWATVVTFGRPDLVGSWVDPFC